MSMQQMIDAMGSSMRLLVASVRSPEDIVALASQVDAVCANSTCCRGRSLLYCVRLSVLLQQLI